MTSQSTRIAYLPPGLIAEIRSWAPPELADTEMYELQRLAERIFAAGYESGWLSGYDEGRDALRRPNINKVNQARKALAEADDQPDTQETTR